MKYSERKKLALIGRHRHYLVRIQITDLGTDRQEVDNLQRIPATSVAQAIRMAGMRLVHKVEKGDLDCEETAESELEEALNLKKPEKGRKVAG